MKTEIRKAAFSDTNIRKKIARRTIDANYRTFLGNKRVDWFIESGASDHHIDENINDCWVIVSDDQTIGFAVCKANFVEILMIDHEYHRQSYGTTLLKHCEQHLFNTSNEIKLESFEGNEKANNFYRHNGWTTIDSYFDEKSGVNKLTFIKRIDVPNIDPS